MCARRFLGCIFLLTILAVVGGVRILPVRGQLADPPGAPRRAISSRRRRAAAPIMPASSNWVARPGLPATDTRLAAGWRRAAPAAARTRRDLLHPPDHLSRDATAGTRRSTDRPEPGPHRLVRPQPGERVQRCRGHLGAALSPGGVWRLPARHQGRAARRSTSPIATSRAAFDAFVAAQPAGRPIILAGAQPGLAASAAPARRRAAMR